MSLKKKILIPVVEAGAGHKMPALAVKDAMEKLYPGRFQIDVIDFFKEAGALNNDKSIKGIWDFALAHPFAARFGYSLVELFHVYPGRFINLFLTEMKKKSRAYIHKYQPDIIFSTHYFCIPLSRMARDNLKLPIKVIGFVTDPFDGFYFWADKKADFIIVSSAKAKEMLIKKKVPAEKIKVFSFPVNQKFFDIKRSKEDLIKEYSINTAFKTILTTAGGQGISNIGKYIKKIFQKKLPFNIISVCGRNETLQNELISLKKSGTSPTNLIPLGFVNNMNELLSISDMAVAKAGASTTFEALFLNNPIIFTHYAAPNEKPNVDFCVENHVGWYTPKEKEFFEVIDRIITTDILNEYKKNLEKLHLNSGSEEIARFVVSELS